MNRTGKIRTLVVDNSPVLRRIVVNILEQAGCEVKSAENGLEALEILTGYLPDIVFTDLIMPRIDGAKLTQILRSTPAYRELFLVILSAIALEDGTNVLELGADVCIAKGPAATLKEHILDALNMFRDGRREVTRIAGMQGLYPREVTSELLLTTRHDQIIFDHMTEAMVELDGFSRIVRLNAKACELFNHQETELLAREFTSILPKEAATIYDRWLSSLCPGSARPLVFPYEEPLRIGSRYLTCSLIPVHEQDQLTVLGILEDVTGRRLLDEQRRAVERDLERMRKLDAMANMASGIAHDFNNLLTIINGNVEMALIHCKDDQITGLLRETEKALRLTTSLIRRFSTFSDNYLPSKARIRIDEFIEKLLRTELNGMDISYTIEAGQEADCVEFDPDLMMQVFQNIIRNSIEAMQGKGEVRCLITMDNSAADDASVPGRSGFVHISLADTGPGMEAEILDKVFDPYFSTKQKGTQKGMGLGLTIAHAIVQKHGGSMRLDSEPGCGCIAHVWLPVDTVVSTGQSESGMRFRVLILVPESTDQVRYREAFAPFNCDLTLTEDWHRSVELFTRSWHDRSPYDLVLIQDDSHGDDAAEAISVLSPDTIVVAVGNEDEQGGSRSRLYAALLDKPFRAEHVQTLFNLCIKRATC